MVQLAAFKLQPLKYFIIILIIVAGIFFYAYKIIGIGKQSTSSHDTLRVNFTDSFISKSDTANIVREVRPWPKQLPLDSIVSFAETLKGVPYLYASTDPTKGFDCSGFITYVFNHFGLEVPRSSVDFTDKGTAIPFQRAERGDLILFTGTDSVSNEVGHMGIITGNTDSLRFIHSSSGKANGVTITALNDYYKQRFVKVISIKDGL